jgi:hypothetical protein
LQAAGYSLKISSASAASSLRALKWELDRIKATNSDVDRLGRKLDDLDFSQRKVLLELEAQMPRIIRDLETLVEGLDDPTSQEILEKLEDLKKSPGEAIFEQAAGLASIVGLLISVLL